MEKKLHMRKAIAVCLMLVFTWLAVSCWVFTYELADVMHCVKQVPECLGVVFGIFGLCSSCIAYGEEKRC